MNVILLGKINNLGELGNVVKVKRGYGRNFLIPYNKAVPASPENLKDFEHRKDELEKLAAERLVDAENRFNSMSELEIVIRCKSGDAGKLFGSINARDLANKLTELGVPTEKSEIRLPQGAIRELGVHEFFVHLHVDVTQRLEVSVIPEE